YANQQGLVPISVVELVARATLPANWLFCDGRSLTSGATYDKLFAVVGYAYGGSGANFNLPNLQQKFPFGANPSNTLGTYGGTFNYSITIGNLPSHAHPITDVAHGHVVNQWAHAHVIATGGHSHGIVTGSHTHRLTQAVRLSYNTSRAAGAQTGDSGAGPIRTDTAGNLGGNTDTAGNLGGNTDTQTSG